MAEVIISTSVLIIMLLIFRRIAEDRISPNVIYAVWLFAALRILVPIPFSEFLPEYQPQVTTIVQNEWQLDKSGLSLGYGMTAGKISEESAANDAVTAANGAAAADNFTDNFTDEGNKTEVSEKTEAKGASAAKRPDKKRTELILWLAGLMSVASVLTAKNINFASRLRKHRVYFKQIGRIKIYVIDGVGAPFVFGVFHPAVYVDSRSLQNEGTLKCVLLHEFGHIKHKDHCWLLVRWLCVCIQWFNPLVWAAAFLSAKDAEIACDYHVICKQDALERFNYGRSLINLASAQPCEKISAFCSPALPFRKKFLKKRVSKIGQFTIMRRSRNLGAAVIAMMIFATALMGCGNDEISRRENTVETVTRVSLATLTRDKKACVVGNSPIKLEAVGYLPNDAYGDTASPWMDGFYIEDKNSSSDEAVYIDLKQKTAAAVQSSEAKDALGQWNGHRYLVDGRLYTYATESSGKDALYVSDINGSKRKRICFFDEGLSPYKAWVFLAYDRQQHHIYYFSEKLEKQDVDFDKNNRYIVQLDLDTKEQTIVGKVNAAIDMRRYGAAGDNIFYMRNETIAVFNLTSGNEYLLSLPNRATDSAWRIYDNKLYYMGKDNNTVLFMDLKTGNEHFVGEILEDASIPAKVLLTDYMWDGKFIFYIINDLTATYSYVAMAPDGGEIKECRRADGGIGTDIIAETENEFILVEADRQWQGESVKLSYKLIHKADYWNGRYDRAEML